MCTWFYVNSNPLSYFTEKALQQPLTNNIMSVMPQSKRMTGNIRPTDMAAVLAPNKQGDMAVFPMVWGFTHEAASQPIINCRIETADQKVLWRDSWFRRRCIIPASWYFEWGIPPSEVGFHNDNEQHSIKKEKFTIQPEGTEITYLAGLYRFEEHQGVQVPMFAVLTRESVSPVRAIHDRMPLILGKEDLRDWIRPDSDPASISKRALTNMVMEKAGNYPDPVPAYMQVDNGMDQHI
ncbi:MAG: SOS response-associated peptidase family protein [Oscillospiraceae bacterium]|nr:SOS response-associated peptidase family protein [Oscillospiraceae bacterium]